MSELKKAIERLIEREPGWRNFQRPANTPAAPIPARRGVGMSAQATAAPSEGGGGEVVLVEADASLREYWPARVRTTSDGLWSWEERPIKSIMLTTGDPFAFAEPPA